MEKNIFQDYQKKKEQIRVLASEALTAGWLDQESYDNILKKIDEDTLTIGVIGQMKCGKSTFLNSFLFGKQLLPAATTPMTAALSVITYGDHKGVTAEFYTPNEWEELKALAARDENEAVDSQTKSSIKAAKELFEKARPIMSSLGSLLGKTREDDFNNLIEYVGADGKYVSIVKSVKITLPVDWLKGVEIVDTPGFNDPVVSREERTKEFLKRADVVLMMVYAGRAFDATDRDILFDKVRRVGVGKIILAVNKYDLQLERGESPEQIKGFVSEEIRKAMRLYKDESLNELLEDLDPLLVSAQMALLAKMPMSEINADKDLKFHYDKVCDDFEVVGQQQLLKLSRIQDLEEKVRDIIVNQKEKILIEKPKNQIFAKAKIAIDEISEALLLLNKKKEELSMPDDELEQRISNLERAQRKIQRKVEFAENDLSDAFDEVSTKLFRKVQDLADGAKAECNRIINTNKRDTLRRKLNDRLEQFENREFPRVLEDINKQLKRAFDDNLYQITDDVESILKKYVDDTDEITEVFIRAMKKGLDVEVGTYRKEDTTVEEDDDTPWGLVALGVIFSPFVLTGWGIASLLDDGKDDARAQVNSFFNSIDWNAMKRKMEERKKKFISTLGGDAANLFMVKLLEQAKEAIGSKEEKERKLNSTIAEIKEKETILIKLQDDFSRLKNTI